MVKKFSLNIKKLLLYIILAVLLVVIYLVIKGENVQLSALTCKDCKNVCVGDQISYCSCNGYQCTCQNPQSCGNGKTCSGGSCVITNIIDPNKPLPGCKAGEVCCSCGGETSCTYSAGACSVKGIGCKVVDKSQCTHVYGY